MAKGAGAKADKAAAAAEKDAKARKAAEDKEADKWSAGAKGKGKGDDKADKAAEAARKKAERDRLLAEEEAATAKAAKAKEPKPAKKAAAPKPKAPAVPDFDAAVSSTPEYSASNIDDALDALSLVNDKTDKAAVGSKAAVSVDAHPERRFKAAFEAYKEAKLPQTRKDYPGLRLQQYHDMLYKDFQKAPENPFNQTTVAYDASKADKVLALQQEQQLKEDRLRTA